MPTLKDLARHLGLSVTQTSRALNDHADVSAATKARVRAGAREIGYRPNLAARTLKSGRSGIVAMVVPGRSETVEVELLMESVMGLSAEFSRRGLRFVLHVLGPDDDAVAAHETLARGGGIDGFVLTDPILDDPRIARLTEWDVPFVVHGRDCADPSYAFVDIDNFAIGRDLGRALVELGARRIAHVRGPSDRPYSTLRRAGLVAALNGTEADIVADLPGAMTEARGRDAAATALVAGADAIVAGNMMLAVGISAAAPDLPVAAHDDRLIAYGSDRVAGSLVSTVAPLAAAWQPICDATSRAILGEIPQILLPVELSAWLRP